MLTLTLTCWTPASAGARELPHLGEALEQEQYRRVDDDGGPVIGRWNRRSAPWHAWELRDGTIVRLQLWERGHVVLDRRFDATGWPVTTRFDAPDEVPRIEVHTVPARELVLSGWEPRPVPGGHVVAPLASLERDGGGARLLVLGGEFDVWHDPVPVDVYDDAFREGLVSSCGCVLVDEAAAWVDSRPGKRFRLEIPRPSGQELLDVWAVPLGAGPQGPVGLWLASYRVTDPGEESLAMAPGRALISLTTLDRVSVNQLTAKSADGPP